MFQITFPRNFISKLCTQLRELTGRLTPPSAPLTSPPPPKRLPSPRNLHGLMPPPVPLRPPPPPGRLTPPPAPEGRLGEEEEEERRHRERGERRRLRSIESEGKRRQKKHERVRWSGDGCSKRSKLGLCLLWLSVLLPA